MEPILLDFVYARDERGLTSAVGAKFLTAEKSKFVIEQFSPAFSEKEIRSIVTVFYDLMEDTPEESVLGIDYDIKQFVPNAYYLEPNGEGRREFLDTLPYIFLGHENIYFIKAFEANKN